MLIQQHSPSLKKVGIGAKDPQGKSKGTAVAKNLHKFPEHYIGMDLGNLKIKMSTLEVFYGKTLFKVQNLNRE